jgi:hypothetical protein
MVLDMFLSMEVTRFPALRNKKDHIVWSIGYPVRERLVAGGI